MLVGRFACVVDACVLHTPLLKAVLMEFADAGLYRLVLSNEILHEWQRSLQDRFGDPPGKAASFVDVIREAFPHSIVEIPPDLLAGIKLPDPGDRHVVAAALIGKASAIITCNLADFPSEALSAHELEAVHPDTFIVNIMDLDEARAAAAIREMRGRWRSPPYSAEQLIAAFNAKGMVQTALRLQHVADSI